MVLVFFFGAGGARFSGFFLIVVFVFPHICSYTQLIQHTDGITVVGLSTCKKTSKMQNNALSGTELFLKDSSENSIRQHI